MGTILAWDPPPVDLEDSRYGDDWAADYDTLTPIPEAVTKATVDFLVRLAERTGGRRVLELACGTGRLALPLAELGYEVVGTDSSARMLEQLRAKDSQGLVATRQEAMEALTGEHDLIACMYNSVLCLPTLARQRALFEAAARALAPGGLFVVEARHIDPRAFKEATSLSMTEDHLMARFGTYDHLSQRVEQYYLIGRPGEAVTLRPDVSRLFTPSEMDLVAELAGLRLVERSSDYSGTPVTAAGPVVSVFARA